MTSENKHNFSIVLLLAASVLIISLALPRRTGQQQLSYEVNKPWIYPMLTAPFDIPKELDEESKARVKDSVEANFIYIYRRDNSIATQNQQSLAQAITSSYSIPVTSRYRLINAFIEL